jgi:hypothetical protein
LTHCGGETVFTRRHLQTGLGLLGGMALFAALYPYARSQGGVVADAAMADHLIANPGDMPSVEEWRLGWEVAPLVRYRAEQKLIWREGKIVNEKSLEVSFGWLSWVTLGAGVGLLWLARRMGRVQSGPVPETTSASGT